MVKKLNNEAIGDEVKAETERFKATCLLKYANATRYDELIEELHNGAYIGIDK